MQLISLTDPAAMTEAGLPFKTTDSARWCFRHRVERGVDAAFVRIGSRVYVDPDKFHQLVRGTSAAAA